MFLDKSWLKLRQCMYCRILKPKSSLPNGECSQQHIRCPRMPFKPGRSSALVSKWRLAAAVALPTVISRDMCLLCRKYYPLITMVQSTCTGAPFHASAKIWL